MPPSRLALLIALLAAAPVGAQQSPGTAPPAPRKAAGNPAADTGYYRVHWVKSIDQSGFSQPVENARLLMPTDWNYQSKVQWGPPTHCIDNLVKVTGRATGHDGISGFEVFPTYGWTWTDDAAARAQTAKMYANAGPATRPCETLPIVGAVDYIKQAILPRYRPGAHIISTEPLPKFARSVEEQLHTTYDGLIQQHMFSYVKADAGRVKIAYETNGQPTEEWIMATISVAAKPAFVFNQAQRGQNLQSYIVTANRVYGFRAPAGKLESRELLFETILTSIHPNQGWVNAKQQVLQSIASNQQMGDQQRNAIMLKAQQDVHAIQNATIQHQSVVQSQEFDDFAHVQRGLEYYNDPNTHEQLELSAGYEHSWVNANGEYILNTNPLFDPRQVLDGTWTELKPEHH